MGGGASAGLYRTPFGRVGQFHRSVWAEVLQPTVLALSQIHLGGCESAGQYTTSFGQGRFSQQFSRFVWEGVLQPAVLRPAPGHFKSSLGGRALAVHYTTRFGTGCFSRLVHRYVRVGVLQPAMKQLKPTVKIPKSKTWPNMNVLSPRMDTSSGPHCSSQACQRTFCSGTRMRSGCQWFAQRTACVCEAVGLNPRPGLEAHSVGCRICCLELYLHRAL